MDGILLNMTWNPATWDVPTVLSCVCNIFAVFAIFVAYIVGKESTENAKKIIKSNNEDAQSQIKALDANTSKQLQKLTKLAEEMAEQTKEVVQLSQKISEQNVEINNQNKIITGIAKINKASLVNDIHKECVQTKSNIERVKHEIAKNPSKINDILIYTNAVNCRIDFLCDLSYSLSLLKWEQTNTDN